MSVLKPDISARRQQCRRDLNASELGRQHQGCSTATAQKPLRFMIDIFIPKIHVDRRRKQGRQDFKLDRPR